MKIKIEFTNAEKETMFNLAAQNEDLSSIDKSAGVKGKFGNFLYKKSKNLIEVNLDEGFMISYSKLIYSAVEMIMSFATKLGAFFEEWMDDAEEFEVVDDEEPKLKCPVERLKTDDVLEENTPEGIYQEPGIDEAIDQVTHHNKEEE